MCASAIAPGHGVIDWEYGEEAKATFIGVRPSDVDIDPVGFAAAPPLDLPAHAAAAYLGPYLLSLLKGFQLEEVVGYPVDIKTRSHTIHTLASPNFWVDIANPHLSDASVSVLGKVARFVVENAETFVLDDDEVRGPERLGRSVDRRLNPEGGR